MVADISNRRAYCPYFSHITALTDVERTNERTNERSSLAIKAGHQKKKLTNLQKEKDPRVTVYRRKTIYKYIQQVQPMERDGKG